MRDLKGEIDANGGAPTMPGEKHRVCTWQIAPGVRLESIAFTTRAASFTNHDSLSFFGADRKFLVRFSADQPIYTQLRLKDESEARLELMSSSASTHISLRFECFESKEIEVLSLYMTPAKFTLMVVMLAVMTCTCCILFTCLHSFWKSRRDAQRILQASRLELHAENGRHQVYTQEEEHRVTTELRALRVYAWTPSLEPQECCLCLQKFEPEDSLRMLPCSHSFHKDCVDAWFAARQFRVRSCPLCNSNPLSPREAAESRVPPESNDHPAVEDELGAIVEGPSCDSLSRAPDGVEITNVSGAVAEGSDDASIPGCDVQDTVPVELQRSSLAELLVDSRRTSTLAFTAGPEDDDYALEDEYSDHMQVDSFPPGAFELHDVGQCDQVLYDAEADTLADGAFETDNMHEHEEVCALRASASIELFTGMAQCNLNYLDLPGTHQVCDERMANCAIQASCSGGISRRLPQWSPPPELLLQAGITMPARKSPSTSLSANSMESPTDSDVSIPVLHMSSSPKSPQPAIHGRSFIESSCVAPVPADPLPAVQATVITHLRAHRFQLSL